MQTQIFKVQNLKNVTDAIYAKKLLVWKVLHLLLTFEKNSKAAEKKFLISLSFFKGFGFTGSGFTPLIQVCWQNVFLDIFYLTIFCTVYASRTGLLCLHFVHFLLFQLIRLNSIYVVNHRLVDRYFLSLLRYWQSV